MTFSDPSLRDRIRLDSVTCVMDTDQVFAHPRVPPLIDLNQIRLGVGVSIPPGQASPHAPLSMTAPVWPVLTTTTATPRCSSTWSYETDQPLALEALRENIA
jgi:hypothetical protein